MTEQLTAPCDDPRTNQDSLPAEGGKDPESLYFPDPELRSAIADAVYEAISHVTRGRVLHRCNLFNTSGRYVVKALTGADFGLHAGVIGLEKCDGGFRLVDPAKQSQADIAVEHTFCAALVNGRSLVVDFASRTFLAHAQQRLGLDTGDMECPDFIWSYLDSLSEDFQALFRATEDAQAHLLRMIRDDSPMLQAITERALAALWLKGYEPHKETLRETPALARFYNEIWSR